MNGGEPDKTSIKTPAAKLYEVLKHYNEVLAKQKFIGGDAFTIADIFHHGQMARDIGYKDVTNSYTNVKKWFNTMSA
ncbi:hypothetical protein THARTR1_01888 [Trichoderma harzianum]|uniref:glutathione transferase n=1 Tax=Trichoderma harzianum TaxID=5544 RepID=A0A2K0UK72_TRIHA|nr:hypothetical protein THARTR1_01888 [Trichoderma harzianum]